MLDTQLQERFARRCTDAAFGYTAATGAAYVAMAEQVFDFWAKVLTPTSAPAAPAETPPWSWPVPARQAAPPPVPFWPFPWAAPLVGPMCQPTPRSYSYPSGALTPYEAWFGMFPFAAPSPAWPMAFMLIASGVPRAVAWPTAEANVAAMEAADAAAVTVQKVFAGYRTDGGHSVVRHPWPPVSLMMFALLAPLNLSTMLSTFRMA
jgi:hypothetical protein